jgi:tRNA dimethylallyltransferase
VSASGQDKPCELIAVVGPTASGKTALAIELAKHLGSEVVSADSMQVYQGMEIGTAAPTTDEQAQVKHHFVSFLDPGEQFSAGKFTRRGRVIVDESIRCGKVTVVAGGAGLYVRALVEGLFAGPSHDPVIRGRLEKEAVDSGIPALFARLKAIDPEYAEIISANDQRRIVRALEVYELTGKPLSKLHTQHQEMLQPLKALLVAFDWPRAELYARINRRVDQMLALGFLDEVKTLLDRGYREHLYRLRSLGYREFIAYLDGTQSYEEASEAMKQNTRRFAKRQLTWFRNDPAVRWMAVDSARALDSYVEEALSMAGLP